MKAIIVAGGRGERLRPITDTLPKPMVPVAEKPILEHTINLLKRHGITEFVIAVCHLHEKITEYFGDGSKLGVQISYVYEDPAHPLGTAGAIRPAKKYIDDTFIVTYSDVLRELDITNMIECHQKAHDIATIQVYETSNRVKSIVTFGPDNRLTEFRELSANIELGEKKDWSNASFYIFEPEIFDYISEGKKTDFALDVFPAVLAAHKNISVYPYNGYIMDVGTMEGLQNAERDIKKPELDLRN